MEALMVPLAAVGQCEAMKGPHRMSSYLLHGDVMISYRDWQWDEHSWHWVWGEDG